MRLEHFRLPPRLYHNDQPVQVVIFGVITDLALHNPTPDRGPFPHPALWVLGLDGRYHNNALDIQNCFGTSS